MSYQDHRDELLTDKGIRAIIQNLDAARAMTEAAGCFEARKLSHGGDSFLIANSVEWLLEHRYLRILSRNDPPEGHEWTGATIMAATEKGH